LVKYIVKKLKNVKPQWYIYLLKIYVQ
jgi:hypothetical protein